MNQIIQKIINHYSSDIPAVRQNLYKILTHGALRHTGKIVMYSIDQGFEIGPDQVFGEFPHGFDPFFHFKLACGGRLNALAAPLGILEASVDQFLGKIPLVLKLNSNNNMMPQDSAKRYQAITASVDDAVRLGCTGIGFTIYPGSEDSYSMYEEVAEIAKEAKSKGLVVIIWSYPKSPDMQKIDEICIDLTGYAIHIASLLGAHIIKAKLPSDKIWNKNLIKQFQHVDLTSLENRIRHVLRCAFAKKRIVLFSGGEKTSDEDFLSSIHAIQNSGGFGSVIGRNFFQRSFADGLSLIENVVNIYKMQSFQEKLDEN